MYKLIPFKAEHADRLCPDAIDPTAREGWKEWAEINAKYGVGYTGIDSNGDLMFAAGIRFKKDGVGDIWSVFSKHIRDNKKATFRTLVNILKIVIKEFGIKKVRSESRIGFEESQRMLEHLGFKRQRRNMINGKYYFYLRGA